MYILLYSVVTSDKCVYNGKCPFSPIDTPYTNPVICLPLSLIGKHVIHTEQHGTGAVPALCTVYSSV